MKLKTFAVEGPTPFPIDMLRYDSCWPASEYDSADLQRVRDADRISIVLATNSHSAPSVDRWRSYGWSVFQ